MKEVSYILVLSKNNEKIIDSASNLASLTKRREKKNYPADTIFVKVDVAGRIARLDTDEQVAEAIVNNALLAGIVAGVDFNTVIERLAAAKVIEILTFDGPAKAE